MLDKTRQLHGEALAGHGHRRLHPRLRQLPPGDRSCFIQWRNFIDISHCQISELVTECLDFVYRNMNHILTVTPTFSCVGDSLVTRLSQMYKPSEIENLSDRRDRIQGRLYTKMVNLLTEEDSKVAKMPITSSTPGHPQAPH